MQPAVTVGMTKSGILTLGNQVATEDRSVMGKQLGKLVRGRLEELDLSARQASEKTTGRKISHATITDAANGMERRFSELTINALAHAIRLDPDVVRAAHDADIDEADHRPLILPARSGALSKAGREALLAHMEWLLEAERKLASGAFKPEVKKPTR